MFIEQRQRKESLQTMFIETKTKENKCLQTMFIEQRRKKRKLTNHIYWTKMKEKKSNNTNFLVQVVHSDRMSTSVKVWTHDKFYIE